jgi:hypothetical protein
MGQVFDQFKQQSSGLVQYRGVQHMVSGGGSQLYDDDENEQQGHYISSDPFSKLKFDDLRKVHKDQTILAVSERDYANVQKFSSVDQYNRERSKQMSAPLEKVSINSNNYYFSRFIHKNWSNLFGFISFAVPYSIIGKVLMTFNPV